MPRILIAEDSPTAIELIKHTLASLGAEFAVAEDGEQATRMCESENERPDLVILDIIMPRMNGFEVCRELRRQPATKRLPIIVVTSMDRESDRYWGLKQGADEYLVKPVDSALLLQKVKMYLNP